MRKKNRRSNYQNMKNALKFDPESFIDSMFRDVVNLFSNPDPEIDSHDAKVHLRHATGIFRQRRKEALMRLLPVVRAKCFSVACGESDEDMTSVYLSNECVPGFDYNLLDVLRDIRLGAIIWILDNLKRAGNLDKVLKHLPYFGFKDDYPSLPKNFYHPCYSNVVLESMMYLITTRFRTSEIQNVDKELANENIILEENAEGREYNAAFREIIDLLPKDKIEEACDAFHNKILEVCEIHLKGYYYLLNKNSLYMAKLKIAEAKARKMIDTKTSGFVGPVATAHTGVSRIDPFDYGPDPSGIGRKRAEANTLHELLTTLKDAMEQASETTSRFNFDFHQYFFNPEKLHAMFNDEDMEEMFLNFQVGDHMAMCFALIYLIDHGDDYPWLFRSGCCVMNECLFGLPWSIGKKEEGLEESRYYDIRCKKFEFAPEGWLDKQFNDVDFISRRNNDRDIAQMFYTLTGCVIPYGMPNPFDTKEYFSGLGLSPYESGFVSGAAYSLYMASKQARLPEETDQDIESEDTKESGTEQINGKEVRKEAAVADLNDKVSELNKTREELQAELLRAKREIKYLKRAAAEDRKLHAAEVEQKDRELNKARLEHRELIDLCGMMFHIHNKDTADSSDTQKECGIKLPYETKKRVVIFGGHETFLKQIKQYLPAAKFVDIDNVSFNPDIVRNADVVWIQNNRISHSQFWNVLREARNYSVQVRYFAFASAEKSAMQVVEDDMIFDL